MSEVFDPYHRWLGIPPEKQPPNHYALLGLAPLESDPDVIDSAADQRMAHLRTFQSGQHGEESQTLLNLVAAARVCLLDPDKKAAYDEQLRKKTLADARIRTGPLVGRRTKLGPIVAALALGVVAVIVLWAVLFRGDDSPSDDLAVNTEVSEPQPRPEQPAAESRPSEPSTAADAERTPNATPTTSTEPESDDRRTLVGLVEEPAADATPPNEPPPADPSEANPSEPDSASIAESRPRLPLPSQEAQDKVLAELAELYQFAALETAGDKLQLAGELLALSRQTQDPAEQFVLRRKAMELAGEGGDAALMLQAIDAVAADFEIDALDVKQKMLVSFAGAGGDSKRIASLVANALPVVDEALAAARHEEAFAILDATFHASQRSANRDDRKRVFDRNKQLADLKQAWERFRQALGALESDADDAQAHLIAGAWLCFYLRDWEKGLPHLAKGSDQPLCAAAEQDLADPADPDAQIAAADAWWDLAESAQDETKDAQLLRAGVWYKKAQPNVTSVLLGQKLTQRLEAVAQAGPPVQEVAGQRPPRTTPPDQSTAMPPAESEVKPSVAAIRAAKRGVPVRVFAAGCNGHEIFLNGIPLMKCSREKPMSAAGVLKEGDVLAVKLGDRFDVMSLWMIFLSPRGEYLFETSDEWIGYLPLDKQRWWDVRGVRPGAQKAEYAPDTRPYVDRVKTAAQQGVPNLPKSQPIYSPLQGEERYSDAYLYYVVKVDDLIPKKPPSVSPAEAVEPVEPPAPVDPEKTAAATPDALPEPSGEVSSPGLTPDKDGWILLPPLVQADRDTLDANWKWDGQVAALAAGKPQAIISFPLTIVGSYELQVRVTITRAKAGMTIRLPVADRRAVVVLMKGDDGATAAPTATIGLQGMKPLPQPQGNVSMKVGTECALSCKVIGAGDRVGVEVRRDGQVLFQWAGLVSQVAEIRDNSPAAVKLTAGYYSSLEFRDLRLRMLAGQVTPTHPE